MCKHEWTRKQEIKNSQPDNSIHGTIKAGAWYTISNVILKGATMILSPIYARLMTLAEYGFNSTITTWFSMLTTVVTGDLSASVNRAKYEFPDRLYHYISSIAFLGTLITTFFYVIVLLFRDFFCSLFGCTIEFIHIQFITLLVSPALGIYQNKCRLENRYKISVALTLGTWTVASACSMLMLVSPALRGAVMGKLANDRVLAMFLGNALPGFLTYIVIYCLLIRRGQVLVNFDYWKFALAMCLPLIPHLLAGNILSHSDRIMITNICGEEFTALYSITYTCSAVISMLFNSLNQAWVPWFNEKYFRREDETVHRITAIYVFLFFAITVFAILLAPELLWVIGGSKYSSAIGIMPVVMISCFIQFSNAFFVNVEMFEKRTLFMALGTIMAAIINIGLNFLWLPKYGYQAGAYTTLIGFLFLHIYHNIVNKLLSYFIHSQSL